MLVKNTLAYCINYYTVVYSYPKAPVLPREISSNQQNNNNKKKNKKNRRD
jgi:hypothetical protein